MVNQVHPRLRAAVMWLPFFALTGLLWWSRAPFGKVGQQVPASRRTLVAFERGGKPPGTAHFDVDAGTIVVAIDGVEKTMSFSCPGFSGDVQPVSVHPKYESLVFVCYRRADGTSVVTRNLLDPERMAMAWRETATDPSGKTTVATSLNLDTRAFADEKKYLAAHP